MTLVNGDFSNNTNNWYFWTNDTGKGNLKVTNKEAVINIAEPGAYPWSIGLIHGNVALEKGHAYRISFKARAKIARDIIVRAMKNSEPYTSYSAQYGIDKIFHISKEMGAYEFTFVMDHPADNQAAINFLFGGSLGNVVIDDVEINQVSVPEVHSLPDVAALNLDICRSDLFGKYAVSEGIIVEDSNRAERILLNWFNCDGNKPNGYPYGSSGGRIFLENGTVDTVSIMDQGNAQLNGFYMGFGFMIKKGAIRDAISLRFKMEGRVWCWENRGRLGAWIINADESNNRIEKEIIVRAEQRRGDYDKNTVPIRLFRNDGTELDCKDSPSWNGSIIPSALEMGKPYNSVIVDIDLRGFNLAEANKIIVKYIAEISDWHIDVGPVVFIKNSAE
jgi:hypothetical protein